jgi:hypothetical protein
MFSISNEGTKYNLIRKLANNGVTIDDIEKEIDTFKKYLIVCDGYEISEECRKDKNNGYHLCNKCDGLENSKKRHLYFTNNKVFNDEYTINGYCANVIKCEQCDKKCYIQEYENYFWKFEFPQSKVNTVNSNANDNLYSQLKCTETNKIEFPQLIVNNSNSSTKDELYAYIKCIESNKFECTKCKKVFSKKSNLMTHLNKKNPCDRLQKFIDNTKVYCEDIISKEAIKKIEECKCPYCFKEFTRKDTLTYHFDHHCKVIKKINKKKIEILKSRDDEIDRLKKLSNILKEKLI